MAFWSGFCGSMPSWPPSVSMPCFMAGCSRCRGNIWCQITTNSGKEASLNACVDAVGGKGRAVQVGLHTKRASIDAVQWALKVITLEATWCCPVQVWPRIARLIASGVFPVEKVIAARIDAADVVAKGFEALLDADRSPGAATGDPCMT